MAKGSVRANLHNTRTQINNAATSAQARAFKARQIAKHKRDLEERKLRAMRDAAKETKTAAPTTTEVPASDASEPSEPKD
ncbi:hypothetical protein AKJ09_00334 [Labilithrix luteola]|uniref:Uncharacterized protein n=1 Tax=Labilithrix luteola TaxID=1391654 RepID=A0A0K1PJG9_9BACT|nr:hypothetical protein [Labilithrix luteola]AKU93670.1 hypothetical protein AKJ09_00334 [Labilithrix luteola]